MLAWVLAHAGRDPGFLIGGAPLQLRAARSGSAAATPFVIEGDEYDTAFFDKGPKFMHYRPDTALLGTVEFDHADIYRDLEQVKTAFRRLVNLVPRRGLLVAATRRARSTREVTDDALCRGRGLRHRRRALARRGTRARPRPARGSASCATGGPSAPSILPAAGRAQRAQRPGRHRRGRASRVSARRRDRRRPGHVPRRAPPPRAARRAPDGVLRVRRLRPPSDGDRARRCGAVRGAPPGPAHLGRARAALVVACAATCSRTGCPRPSTPPTR